MAKNKNIEKVRRKKVTLSEIRFISWEFLLFKISHSIDLISQKNGEKKRDE